MIESDGKPWQTPEDYLEHLREEDDSLKLTLEITTMLHEMVSNRVKHPLMSLDDIGSALIDALDAIRMGIEQSIKDREHENR